MGQINFDDLHGKTIFITGSDKNAGKTTILNYLLQYLRKKEKICYLSIGIDGEKEDQVFGTPKPRIYCEKGDNIVTSESMLYISEGLFEIKYVFNIKTVLGKLLLAENIRSGFIELVGPEDNNQLRFIIDYLKNDFKTILIDGAVNRITQVSAFKDSYYIYVMRITPQNINSSIDKIKTLNYINKIDIFFNNDEDKFLYEIKGALTKSKLSNIPDKTEIILLEDFTKIFLNYVDLINLSKKYKIFLKNKLNFLFFVINLYDLEVEEFKLNLKKQNIDIDNIVFNPYKENIS